MNHKLWIDALDFQFYGGWKCDTQFTHLMGSGYLIACDTPGQPVADATTAINIPAAGRYRAWVRARNWYYSDSPGKFTIAIDGKRSPVVLGQLPSNEWVWQIAGDFELTEGEHKLSLIDLTGYFGRCSSIVLTDNMDYIPPRPVAEFERERAKCKDISLEPADEGSYDIIVAGGGPGGVPSAIAAARHGAKTLLVTNRNILGGNASIEAGVGFNGASARQPNAREGGIAEEIIRTKGRFNCTWTEALERLCNAEMNLTIVYNIHICGAEVKDSCIKEVIGRHTIHGTYHRYKGKLFIDSTGDSWVAYHAGAGYRIGREAKWQFGEEFAPETADLLTMSGCLMNARFEDTGKPVPYTAPDWVPVFNSGKAFGRNIEWIGPVWWNEAPNVLDDLYDGELARDELFRVMLGYFNYLKNLWDDKEKAANYAFTYINYINAKRESRRIIGDYTLTQNDCVGQSQFEDVVAHSGWPIDLHHPKGIYSGEEGPFFSNTHVPMVQIPYRCLYSANIDNLFAAGRNISVTHVALGTTRVQSTIAAMAQAAGTAAAMCLSKNVNPRELGQMNIKELQQLLIKDDQFIPGFSNEDSADFARVCKAEASSVAANEIYTCHLGIEERLVPLDKQRTTFYARGVSEHLPSLYIKLHNDTDSSIPVTIRLREQADPDGYTTQTDLLTMTRAVPPGEHWVQFPVDLHTKLRYLWVLINPTAGINWRILKYPALDWTRSERDNENEPFENIRGECHCISLTPPIEEPADCSPSNVINGYSRIHNAKEYAWVSDSTQALPQWISLTYPNPTAINEIQLTFDTDMNNMAMLNPIACIPKQLVTDYTLSVLDEQGWHVVAEVNGNYLRKRVHTFDKRVIKQLKLTISGTGDNKTARVLEIRSYCN